MALRVVTDQNPVTVVTSRPAPVSQSALASGAYQAADPAPVELTPPQGVCSLMLIVDITVLSGAGCTLTVNVDVWDDAKGAFVNVGASAGLTATGSTKVIVSPYLTAAANILQSVLGGTMRIRPVKSGTTTTLTYSIGAHWSA